MFDNICIVHGKVTGTVAVFDDDALIHMGSRPVDFNFAERVHKKLLAEGYQTVNIGQATFYDKKK